MLLANSTKRTSQSVGQSHRTILYPFGMNTISSSCGSCGSCFDCFVRLVLLCPDEVGAMNAMILRSDPFQHRWYDGFVNTLAYTAQELRDATTDRNTGVW